MGISERVQEAWDFEDDAECAESGIHRKVVEPISTLDRLFAASSCLGSASGKDDLLTCMARVKSFLDTTSTAELFFDLFDDASAVRSVTRSSPMSSTSDSSFRSPSPATSHSRPPRLGSSTPTIGPSAVVARELGSLVGRESVPTTIFKVSAQSTAGHTIRFEAFIPSDVDDKVVNGWMPRTSRRTSPFTSRTSHRWKSSSASSSPRATQCRHS